MIKSSRPIVKSINALSSLSLIDFFFCCFVIPPPLFLYILYHSMGDMPSLILKKVIKNEKVVRFVRFSYGIIYNGEASKLLQV